jgi:hypothetical protein
MVRVIFNYNVNERNNVMDLIATLTARIEERLKETKKPCKAYATKEAADKATLAMATKAGIYFDAHNRKDARPARYVVFYMESMQKWVGAIDLTEVLNRKNCSGGYVGVCTGFYTY